MAEIEYKSALRLRPDYINAANNLAAMLGSQGRNDEAERYLRNVRAATLHPVESFDTNLRMMRKRESQASADAVDAASKGPAQEPEFCQSAASVRNALRDPRLVNRAALARLQEKQFAQAKDLARVALQLDPTLIAARLNLVQASLLMGDKDAAARELDVAFTMAPNDERVARLAQHLQKPSP
jgi:Tfp pilus assembly protein PilF